MEQKFIPVVNIATSEVITVDSIHHYELRITHASFFSPFFVCANDLKARNVDILHHDGWDDLKNILTQYSHTKSSTDEKQAIEPIDYLYSVSFLKMLLLCDVKMDFFIK